MKTTRTCLIVALASALGAIPATLHASAAWGLESSVHGSTITKDDLPTAWGRRPTPPPLRSGSERPHRGGDKTSS